MPANRIDALYLAYVGSPDDAHLNDLLAAVHRDASMTFRSVDRDHEDIASQVVVKVWRGLHQSYPHANKLVSHDPAKGKFSAFLARIKRTVHLQYRRIRQVGAYGR
jgi:DNA-directed RNA polymerase specialized sigma24 family protein